MPSFTTPAPEPNVEEGRLIGVRGGEYDEIREGLLHVLVRAVVALFNQSGGIVVLIKVIEKLSRQCHEDSQGVIRSFLNDILTVSSFNLL